MSAGRIGDEEDKSNDWGLEVLYKLLVYAKQAGKEQHPVDCLQEKGSRSAER